MKRFFVLVLAMVALLPISSALADHLPLAVKNGDSISICARQYYDIELDGEPDKIMEWSTSDEDVFWVTKSLGKYVLIASGQGSAYLNGKASDGSGEKVKVKITVPKVYTTHDKIVIDSPEGVEFGYAFNMSGYLSVSHSGKCFTTERMDDVGEISMSRIKPVKVGTGSIVFTGNGKTVKTVKIEVKKSAFEEKKEDSQEIPANAEAVAVVKKGVNIRSKANADSEKVGSAKAGERLTVTQAFYSEKWHQIMYDGQVCYVSANYCDIEYTEQGTIPVAQSTKPTAEPAEAPTPDPTPEITYIGNKNTKKFHYEYCSSVDDMKAKNKVEFNSRETALDKGYSPCKRCKP